jgi:hypothetical protein
MSSTKGNQTLTVLGANVNVPRMQVAVHEVVHKEHFQKCRNANIRQRSS